MKPKDRNIPLDLTHSYIPRPEGSLFEPPYVPRMDLAQINFNPQAIFEAPCHMNFAERMWLFATVYALGVERYLEIGTARGGSALIVDLAFAILERGGVTCRGVLIDKSFSNVSS